DVVLANGVSTDELLRLVASLEQASEHPLGAAIVKFAKEKQLLLATVDEFDARAGRGVVGRVPKPPHQIAAGNRTLLTELGIDPGPLSADADRLAAEGKTPVLAAIDGRLAGVLAVADPVKPTARE